MPRLQNIFEILRFVPLGCLRVVERIEHAHAFNRRLLNTVDGRGVRHAGGFKDGGCDVDDVMELAADLAPPVTPFGQCTMVPLRVPPQCDATCLVHW